MSLENSRSQRDRIDESSESMQSVDSQKKLEQKLPYVDEQLDKAFKEGVIRREDRMKVYASINNLRPAQLDDLENILNEYIGTKREKREEYQKELQKAQAEGLLTEKEAKEYLEGYTKLSGKERKLEAETGLPKKLERKKLEKKEFSELLDNSPHFFHNGERTKEGQAMLDEYNKLPEGEKKLSKRRLLRKIAMLDRFSDLCKDRYQVANEHYLRGNYEQSVALMKKNVKTCERYPESARLSEFKDFAQWDANNGAYELQKHEGVQEKRAEVSECLGGNDQQKDYESALKAANEAVSLTERFISKTYDGRMGEYQEGSSAEKDRSDKWVTPYMRSMLTKVQQEQAQVKNIYNTFLDEEAAEEQRILQDEQDAINSAQAEDKTTQAVIKAGLDTLEAQQNPVEVQAEEQQKQDALKEDTVSSANNVDYTEDPDLQHAFSSSEQSEQFSKNQEQSDVLEDQVEQKNVIDEQKEGVLTAQKAEEMLQSDERLTLQKDGRELKTEDEIQKELSEKIKNSRLDEIDRLHRQGVISKENLQDHKQQAEQDTQIGKDLNQAQKQQRVIDANSSLQSQRRLTDIFKKRGPDLSQKNKDEKERQRRLAA